MRRHDGVGIHRRARAFYPQRNTSVAQILDREDTAMFAHCQLHQFRIERGDDPQAIELRRTLEWSQAEIGHIGDVGLA